MAEVLNSTRAQAKSFSRKNFFPGGYIVLTDPSAKILYASFGITEKTGYFQEEVLDMNPGKLWGGHMEKSFYEKMWSTLQQEKLPFVGTMKNSKKDGVTMIQQVHIAPIFDKYGRTKYYLEVQPDLKNPQKEAAFQKNFTGLFRNPNPNTTDLVDLFDQWLGSAIAKGRFKQDDAASLVQNLFLSSRELALLRDKKLINAAKDNHELYGDLYEKYRRAIYGYFLCRVNFDSALAQDLTEDTFLKSFEAFPHFAFQKSTYLHYLFIVASHILINSYRIHKPVSLEEIGEQPSERDKTFEDELQIKEKAAEVWKAVQGLPPAEKQAVLLRYQYDLHIKEIAHLLKKSENAVKLLLSRARKQLRRGRAR